MDLRSQFRTLRDVASLINASSDLPATLEHLVRATTRDSVWAMSAVMSVDQKSGYAHVVVRHDPSLLEARLENRWRLATSPSLIALTTNQPVVIPDASLATEFPGYQLDARQRGYRTVVVLPMGCVDAEGRAMVLTVQSRNVVEVTEEELIFLSSIVHLGAIAVEKAHRQRADRILAERLQRALQVHSALMSQVLSDGSVASAAAAIGELFPNPIVAVDFSANLVVGGRSPKPDRYDDGSWSAAVRGPLSRPLMRAARVAADSPRSEPWDLLLDAGTEHFRLSARIEVLSVDHAAVGALLVFPSAGDFEDLDQLLLDSATFALSVQMMRSYLRFQNEAQTVGELFEDLFEGRGRDMDDVAARARRLGIDPGAPVRLITVSLPAAKAPRPPPVEMQRSVARCVQQHAGSPAVTLGDVIVCLAPPRAAGRERGDRLTQAIIDEVVRVMDEQPVVIESGRLGSFEDFPAAWQQCRRLIALACRFGRRGALAPQDFGPFPMLLAAADAAEVQLFVDSQIGAVARYDAAHATAYVETLARYLDFGCRNQACADAMGLHVTTLRYRLTRIHELFGIEIDTQDRRFALELAIRLHATISGAAPSKP